MVRPEPPLPLRCWFRGQDACQDGVGVSKQGRMYFKTYLTPYPGCICYRNSRLQILALRKPPPRRGEPLQFDPFNPENSRGGSEPQTTVGVLWGPDSFTFSL
jgi:hypothetical protein